MPNEKGWYSKEEVLETGLPYYIPNSSRWTEEPYEFAVLLTKSRCKEFGIPILRNGNEKPSAFRYGAAAGTGTGDNKHRYFPLYDRTDVYEAGELSLDKLYKHEIMGTPEREVDCPTCGGNGFSGQGTTYGDICDDCGGNGKTLDIRP